MQPFVYSNQKYTYNAHNTTHIELYIGNIFATKKIAHITATYEI